MDDKAKWKVRKAMVVALVLGAAGLALAQVAPPEPDKTFNAGLVNAVNNLFGDGRSGWSWAFVPPPTPDSPSTLVGTLTPATNRTQIAEIVEGPTPHMRLTVATDAAGVTTSTLEVDTAALPANFRIVDTATGASLNFCAVAPPEPDRLP